MTGKQDIASEASPGLTGITENVAQRKTLTETAARTLSTLPGDGVSEPLSDSPVGKSLTPSLNEMEVLARYACRGAGMSWGLAEEAARSARWLMVYDYPGPEMLAGLLRKNDGVPLAALTPALQDEMWSAPIGRLCPIIAGTILCDRAASLREGRRFQFATMCYPLLILPAVAQAAKLIDRWVNLYWQDLSVSTDGRSLHTHGNRKALYRTSVDVVVCSAFEHSVERRVKAQRRQVDRLSWKQLQDLAQRVYAPATEESRNRDAGAWESDND